MNKLFPNYIINLKKGTVFSKRLKRFIGKLNGEYYEVRTKDVFGNIYTKIHQIIYAYGANLPKHLWPVDENGRMFEVDHIKPIKNGGDDSFKNLRLVSKKDNSNNALTKINQKKARKNVVFTDEWRKNLSEAQKKAYIEGRKILNQSFIDGRQKYNESIKQLIYQYTLTGELVAVYNGGHEAERETGYCRERISFHCKDGKPYKGYIWSYTQL